MNSDSVFFLVVGAIVIAGIAASAYKPEPSVVYVGTDCQGASSVAVARTSFDLPPCASIEVHQVAG